MRIRDLRTLVAQMSSGAAIPSAVASAVELATALTDKQSIDEKGQPNGYASLASDGKVPLSQLSVESSGANGSSASADRPYLRKVADKLQKIDAGTATDLRVMYFGDSVAAFKLQYVYDQIVRMAGGGYSGGFDSGPLTGMVGVLGADTATVAERTADFDSSPSGRTTKFTGAGAKRSYGAGGANARWTEATLFYVKEPGAGHFKIQVDDADETGFTDIDASAVSISLGIARVTRGVSAARKLSVVGVSGDVRTLGWYYRDANRSGGVAMGIGQGGITLQDAISTAGGRANFQAMLAELSPDVIVFEMKENASYLSAAITTWLDLVQAGAPNTDVVLVGSTPISGDDADQRAQNAILKAKAAEYGVIYFDSYTPFKNYAELVAKGWQGDGTHVAAQASKFGSTRMWAELGLWEILRGLGRAAFNHLRISGKAVFGVADDGTDYYQIEPDATFKLDGYHRVRRMLRIIDWSGAVVAQFAGSNSFATWLASGTRKGFRIGSDTGPWIQQGTGSPEANVVAPIGSVFLRTDAPDADHLTYFKATGTGNTGWMRVTGLVAP